MRLLILFVFTSSIAALAAEPAQPSRRAFLQGAASVPAAVAVNPLAPQGDPQANAVIEALQMEFRSNRHDAWFRHIQTYFRYGSSRRDVWERAMSGHDSIARLFDSEPFYDKMVDIETELAKEMGVSPSQVAQAIDFMWEPTSFVRSALDGRLAKNPYPCIYTEEFVEKYLAQLKKIAPPLEEELRSQIYPNGTFGYLPSSPRGANSPRSYLLSLVNVSETSREMTGMLWFNSGAGDALGYHQPLEIALPKMMRARLLVLQRFQKAEEGMKLMLPSKWRDGYLRALEDLQITMKAELANLPRLLRAWQLENYRHFPDHWRQAPPPVLSEETTALLNDPVKWAQVLEDSARAMNLLVTFVEKLSEEDPCGKELALETQTTPVKQLSRDVVSE